MDLTNKIIIFRDRAGLRQEDVAERLGISKSSYSRKEKGVTSFTFEEINKLFDILGFTVSDFRELEFPIIREETISAELLDNLETVLSQNSRVDADWNMNRNSYNCIQKALTPVLDERTKSFDFPDINIDSVPRGTTVKEVLLDVRAENLINEALETQKKLAHAIFGAEL